MTNTVLDLALIQSLRNKNIYNVRILDTMEEQKGLQVWFYDKSRVTLVLTEPITNEEAIVALNSIPKARRRMAIRAYSL